jgi:hypothetical protein
MSAGSDGDAPGRGRRVADLLEREPVWAREFTDPRYEWRRWFSELFGTFLLVLAGGGAPVVDTLSQGAIGQVAAAADSRWLFDPPAGAGTHRRLGTTGRSRLSCGLSADRRPGSLWSPTPIPQSHSQGSPRFSVDQFAEVRGPQASAGVRL